MSKKKLPIENDLEIDTSAFGIMHDIKDKQKNGEKVDDYTKEAIKSVEFANNLMDLIMSGKQVDLVFYKMYTKRAIQNLRDIDKRNGIKRNIKTRIED